MFVIPIYNTLAKYLEENDISQAELCKMLKCSKGTISNIVRNLYQPSFDLAYRIAYVLNVEITEIFHYKHEE